MQITLKDRETLNGAITIQTNPLDVSDVPMLTESMIVHSIGGSSPDLAVQLQTSDNLENWVDMGSPINRTTAGVEMTVYVASANPWGRYVRAQIALSGTSAVSCYSLFLSTFPSS